MAGNKVSKDDIFDGDLFAQASKDITAYTGLVAVLEKTVTTLAAKFTEVQTVLQGLQSKGLTDSKDIAAYNKAMTDSVQIETAVITTKKALVQATEQEIKVRLQQQAATAAQKKELKEIIVLESQETGTLAKLRAENSLLTQEREKLNLKTKEGQDRLKGINEQLDKNNEFIRVNSDRQTQNKINIGNYTESIKKSLTQSGLFGESVERITAISEKAAVVYELLHNSIDKIAASLGLHRKATEANTIATQANTQVAAELKAAQEGQTIATELNSAAVEVNTIAHETENATIEAKTVVVGEATAATIAQTAAIEAESVATEGAEVATGRLTRALNFIKANPVLLVIAGLAAAAAAFEAIKKSTQEGEDSQNRFRASTTALAKALFTFGAESKGYTVNAAAAARAAGILAKAQQELRDEQDANIVTLSLLNQKAAEARLEAEKENATTQEKIDLLQKVIDTRHELAAVESEEAKKVFGLKIGTTDLDKIEQVLQSLKNGDKKLTRQDLSKNFNLAINEEQVKEADEAAGKIFNIQAELAANLRRVTTRQTGLLDKDREERKKLLQDAQKEEIEAIRVTGEKKFETIDQQRSKDIKEEKNRFAIELDNLKEQQRKMGLLADPAKAAQQQADFNREQEAALRSHLTAIFNIKKRANEEANAELHKQAEEQEAFNNRVAKTGVDLIVSNPLKPEDTNKAIAANNDAKRLAQEKADNDRVIAITNARGNKDEIIRIEQERKSEQLAIDIEFSDKEAAILADAFKKTQDLNKKELAEYTDLQNQKLLALELSLTKQGKSQEDIEKQLVKAREKALEDEIKFAIEHRQDATKLELDLLKLKKEEEKKANKEILDEAEKLTSYIEQGLQKRNDLQNKFADYDISIRQKAVDRQLILAAAGKKNDFETQRAGEAQAELRRKDELQRQAKQQEAIKLGETFINILNQRLDKGDNYTDAIIKATTGTFEAKAISAAIAGAFYGGSEKIENDLNPSFSGRDGYLVRVDGKERVMTGAQNEMVGDLSNEQLAQIAFDYNMGRHLPKYALETGFTGGSTGENMANSLMVQQFAVMNKKLDYLEQIANKPDTVIQLDEVGNIIEKRTVKGMTNVVKKMTSRVRI